MVAMTYMLCCASRGLATIPMEGINAWGIKHVLRIPQGRYAIPLIVSTGLSAAAAADQPSPEGTTTTSIDKQLAATAETSEQQSIDQRRRYDSAKVIFENVFGEAGSLDDSTALQP
eukprot:CAMPEP_0168737690 /NCGR_PEP_ID=MMETSP0724-20121128/10527_1 /TAXON_ID=265536 /ORGANISM="Amphiprora sp., Strain CCMP467" /LENGTH=115 /DNA_ID=CAMNT_0008784969 /DNA_START=95 /DNA_END=442 /DNA_ORIENTATION=-